MLLLAEPDLGTAIALLLMLGAMLLVAGTPARVLALALAASPRALGTLAIWVEPYQRARAASRSSTRGTTRRAPASRSSRR